MGPYAKNPGGSINLGSSGKIKAYTGILKISPEYKKHLTPATMIREEKNLAEIRIRVPPYFVMNPSDVGIFTFIAYF